MADGGARTGLRDQQNKNKNKQANRGKKQTRKHNIQAKLT